VVESPEKRDIIETSLRRSSSRNDIIPMDEAKYVRIKKSFEKRGGMIASSPEIDNHLDNIGAEASTMDAKTILVRHNYIPSASAMFEELIHTAQYRTGRATGSNWIEMEIEAKRKLIKNQKNYDIPSLENDETIRQLDELLRLKEGG